MMSMFHAVCFVKEQQAQAAQPKSSEDMVSNSSDGKFDTIPSEEVYIVTASVPHICIYVTPSPATTTLRGIKRENGDQRIARDTAHNDTQSCKPCSL